MPGPHYVVLNSVRYPVKDGIIRRFKVKADAPVVRQSGRQRVESLTARQSYIFPSATMGMGLRRIPSDKIDDPILARRSWDSELDTRFETTTLPLLAQGSTEPTLAGDNIYGMRAKVNFKGALWGFFHGENVNIMQGAAYAREYTGSSTTWTGGGVIASSGTAGMFIIPISATIVSNRMVVLVTRGDDHLIYHSTDGATWTAASTQPTVNQLANVVTQGERIDAGVLVTIGNTVYLFLWDEDNDQIEAWSSTDLGTTWAVVSGSPLVAPGGGPKGGAPYYDLNGDEAPVFSTRDGLYALDTSANTLQRLTEYLPHDDTGRGLTRWPNPYAGVDALYCGTGDGDIMEYIYLGGGGSAAKVSIRNVGPIKGDGLVADRQGSVTWMEPSPRWLFFAYGGLAASRNATIFAWDGKGHLLELDGAGHHFMYQNGTANERINIMALSNADDGKMRLHFQEQSFAVQSSISFNAASSGSDTTADELTVAHVCTGSNLLLIVYVATADSSPAAPTGVAYSGVAMTQFGTHQTVNQLGLTAWYLIGPATGENNIIVRLSGDMASLVAAGMSFTGVEQTTALSDATETAAGLATSLTAAPPSRSDVLSFCGVAVQNANAHTPHSGDTERADVAASGAHHVGLSINTQAGAATTVTLGASWTNTDENAIIAGTMVRNVSVSDTQFLEEPLVGPESGIARKFHDASSTPKTLDRPEVDMGLPRDQMAVIALFHQARDLGTTSQEYVNWDYGADGATPSTDFGNIIGGTLEIALASGAGVAMRSVQLRENWFRRSGDNTETPAANSVEVMYRKKIASLNGWRFTIDLQTFAVAESRPIADILADIETAESNVPLQAFTPRAGSGATTYYVSVEILSWTDEYGNRVTEFEDLPGDVAEVSVELKEVIG